MSNNPNSLKNLIKRYFIKKESSIEDIPEITPLKSTLTTSKPIVRYTTKTDISKYTNTPALSRAMKALQLSNPFKGV